jgi:glycerophosphoryl diester phosphodiesterase
VSARLVTVLALCAIAIGAGVLAIGPVVQPLPAHPFWDAPGPRVIAHRGGGGLWPENTLHAFRAAAALGAHVIEMDLRRAADGEIVVLHDETVDRTTDGRGNVAALTLGELQRLDAGYRWTADEGRTYPYRGHGIAVPTLRQVFAALPEARMNLEIKPGGPAMAVPLCALIRSQGMTRRVVVASVDQRAIDEFRIVCPEVATAATRNEVVRFVLFSAAFLGRHFAPPAPVLQVPEEVGPVRLLTPRFLRDARRLNIKVEVWTVNEPGHMRRLLALPVDAVMTDYPDRLLPLLARPAD